MHYFSYMSMKSADTVEEAATTLASKISRALCPLAQQCWTDSETIILIIFNKSEFDNYRTNLDLSILITNVPTSVLN